MVENKQIAMRLPPDVLAGLDEIQNIQRWTPGQAVSELVEYRKRIAGVANHFGVGIQPNGEQLVYYQDSEGSIDIVEGDGLEALTVYLVRQLNMAVNVGFRETPDLSEIL